MAKLPKGPASLRASCIAQSDIVVVKVGTEGKKYTLHKRLLAHHSEYFRGALSESFKETNDGCITLDDVDTDPFDIFVDWIYEQKLHKLAPSSHKGPIETLVWGAYILANRLLVTGLKREIMTHVFNVALGKPFIPFTDRITYLFENLAEGDPLLRFIVDSLCINDGLRAMQSKSIETVPQLPQAYLSCVFVKLIEISNTKKEDLVMKLEDYFED